MKQEIISKKLPLDAIKEISEKHSIQRFMLVCDSAFEHLSTFDEYNNVENIAVKFSNFSPNPLYDEICEGVNLFKTENCDAILAVGGGSAIDTAKCIKAFSQMSEDELYLTQPFRENSIPFIAVPTTAGTGSESTRYAVCYYQGEKQSVTDDTLIPNYAILDARNLKTLPLYQKKCTMLDALCQGIESWWSVNSTAESREISHKAVLAIMSNINGYLDGNSEAAEKMMYASNLAGQAINITQTTAAHAMSYKLTSIYKIPHGRAAFVCLPYVWEYMIENSADNEELRFVFYNIATALGCKTPIEAVTLLKGLNKELFGNEGIETSVDDIPLLAASVNPTRLKNNPVKLTEETLTELYTLILKELRYSDANRSIGEKFLSFIDKCFSNYPFPSGG